MGDARTEAIEAMVERLVVKWREEGETSQMGPAERKMARSDSEDALDAIPTAALVRLVIERGGFVPSVWEVPADQTPMGVSEPEYYPYDPDDEDALDAADQLGHALLYRIAEEPS